MFKEKRLVFKENGDLSQYAEMAKAAISGSPEERSSKLWASQSSAQAFNEDNQDVARKVTVDPTKELEPTKNRLKQLKTLPSQIVHGTLTAVNSVVPLATYGVEWARGTLIDNPINLVGTLAVLASRKITNTLTIPSRILLNTSKRVQAIIDKIPGANG